LTEFGKVELRSLENIETPENITNKSEKLQNKTDIHSLQTCPTDTLCLSDTSLEMETLVRSPSVENKVKNGKLEKQNQIRQFFLAAVLKNSKNTQTHTFPTITSQNSSSQIEHEATTCQLNQEVLNYLQTRGLGLESAKSLVVSGFCSDVLSLLPMEFAFEAKKLVELTLENGFG